tara:strand:+ start:2272 stop:2814 length:543 start_codon:yes stop_codon:yes gene_type:complete
MKKVIFFNGLPGSGKLTIANLLANKTGAKVIDNHKVNNLVFDIKEFGEDVPEEVWKFTGLVKDSLLELLSSLKQTDDYIFTGCLAKPTLNGYHRSKKLADAIGAELFVITLECSNEEVLNRADTPERRARKKLTDIELYKKLMETKSIINPDLPNCYTINNTNQTPEETLVDVIKILECK